MQLLDKQQQRKLTADADADFAKGLGGGFGVGGPVGAPASPSSAPASGVPSFLDLSGPSGSYQANLFKRESNFNSDAQAGTSSARGLGQFTTGTWNRVAAQHPDLGLTPVTPNSDGRTDPNQMVKATTALTTENEGALQRFGLPVNDATRYALHFLGAGGGVRLVGGAMSNPDMPAARYASPQAVAANRNVFYNKDGSAKTAGEVLGDFARSFGGGGGRAAAQTAAPQVASADPSFAPQMPTAPAPIARASAQPPVSGPTPDAAPDAPQAPAAASPQTLVPQSMAGLGIPGTVMDRGNPVAQVTAPQAPAAPVASLPPGLGAGLVRGPPSSAPTATSGPGLLMPAPGGGAAPGRVMTMPGDDPAPVPAGPDATPTDRAFSAQSSAIAQSPLGQRIPFLLRAVANPNLSEGPRQVAQTMLKQALDETAMPAAVKEWRYAQANGLTQARTPAEYAAEMERAKTRDPGADLQSQIRAREAEGLRMGMQPGSDELRNFSLGYKPTADKDKGADAAALYGQRKAAALEQGLQPGTPEFENYALTGKTLAEKGPSPTVQKMVGDTEKSRDKLGLAVQALQRAQVLSEGEGDAGIHSGNLAGLRTAYDRNAPSWAPGANAQVGANTTEYDNLVQGAALGALKDYFGGRITNYEDQQFQALQPGSGKSQVERKAILKNLLDRYSTLPGQEEAKLDALRQGTFFRPQGPGQQQARGGGAGAPPALPAPAPSNRPGAVPPAARFQQLIGSGMSEDAAYARLHQEGY